jgi:N-acetylglucosaminyldiphosphoundecaprenol N-acetyl-beta-D-mannosaminyltransferase
LAVLEREEAGATRAAERRQPRRPDVYRLYAGEMAQLLRRRSTDGPRLIVTPNLDHLRLLDRRAALRRAYARADVVLNDSRFLDRAVFRARVNCLPGSELAPEILDASAPGRRIMVIGASAALERWARAAYPDLGFLFLEPSHGYVLRRAERRGIVQAARDFAPHQIFVCTGAPQSEVLGLQLKRGLTHRCDILCCGAALQFLAGEKARAPVWLRGLGLEWTWRFLREGRVRGRYLADLGFLVARSTAFMKLRTGEGARLGRYSVVLPPSARP